MEYPKWYDSNGEMTPERAVELFGAQVIGQHGKRPWWIKELRQRDMEDEYTLRVKVIGVSGQPVRDMPVTAILHRGASPQVNGRTGENGEIALTMDASWAYNVTGPLSQGPVTVILSDVDCEGYDSAGFVILGKHNRRCLDVTFSNEPKEPAGPPINPPVEPPTEPPIEPPSIDAKWQLIFDRLDRIIELLS